MSKDSTRTYSSWCNMRKRVRTHPRYAGRGITIAKEWDSYAVFLADIGPRPDGMSIDRIDPNGNYCKENCRWATHRDQCRNRCNAVFYTICGETRQLVEWAEFTCTWMGVFKSRVTSGRYDDGEVLFCPLKGKANARREQKP